MSSETHAIATVVKHPRNPPEDVQGEVEFRICRLCGSMVADQDLHDLWHVRLASPQTYR